MNKFSNWLKNEESGQHGGIRLIVALIAIVIVAALVVLGPEIASIYIKR